MCYDGSYNHTNNALIDLFRFFGCDITRSDPGKRLFFTNYSLGYRDGTEQGGMTKALIKQDDKLFKMLVEAIKPKFIICLGKMTYECVMHQI